MWAPVIQTVMNRIYRVALAITAVRTVIVITIRCVAVTKRVLQGITAPLQGSAKLYSESIRVGGFDIGMQFYPIGTRAMILDKAPEICGSTVHSIQSMYSDLSRRSQSSAVDILSTQCVKIIKLIRILL